MLTPRSMTAGSGGLSARVGSLEALAAALWPCALYFLCSLAMNMLTKALLTTYAWRAVYALGAVQNAFILASLALYAALRRLLRPRPRKETQEEQEEEEQSGAARRGTAALQGAAATTDAGLVKGAARLLGQARVAVPLVVLHLANVLLGFAGLRAVNLPMYLVLRRLTTLKILLIEWLVLHKTISNPVKLALLVSAIGSVVAGATDAAGDMRGGYALVLLQNVCSACSLAFSKESALSSTQLMALNSAVGVLCCSWLALWLEWPLVRDFPHAGDPVFVALLLSTCAMCVLYQFSVYNCTLRTSALTTSVTGNIKDLAATVGGFLLFPDAHLSAGNVAGVALSFLGAYSFSYARYRALTAGDKPKSKQR